MDKTYRINRHLDGGAVVEEGLPYEATSIGEALAMAERDCAGKADATFGINAEDYAEAKAEGIAFNEADGMLV